MNKKSEVYLLWYFSIIYYAKYDNQYMQGLSYQQKDEDILYFLHIPKTGGTTLTSILDNYYNLENILPEQVWNKFLLSTQKKMEKIKFIRGHFGYGIYRIFPKKLLYITMLRNPVEHVISYYNHIKREPIDNRWIPANIFSEEENLMDILHDDLRNKIFWNSQTQHLALDIDVLSEIKSRRTNDKNEYYYEWELAKKAEKIPDKELLKLAKKNLIKFKFFGFVEKYFESLCLLWYTFGWKPINTIPKFQMSPNKDKENITDEIISSIKKFTGLDNELYNFAKKEFGVRYESMLNNLEQKFKIKQSNAISKSENLKRKLEKNYEEYYWNNKKPVDHIKYNFSEKLLGVGWHSRERFQNTEKIFRWSGPENISVIDLPQIKGKNFRFSCECINYLVDEIVNELKISLNDMFIPLSIKHKSKKEILIESKFSDLPFNNFLRLKFKIPKTYSPKSIKKKSEDLRRIGFALHKIEIECVS